MQSQQYKPTISGQQIQEIYGLLAGGADDPASIGTQYVKAMQGNDLTQASQARRSGFNPIVDKQGNVWFPKAQPDGTTGLSPALDEQGKQIKTDPRFSTFDIGGGATGSFQTSGGASGADVRMLTSPEGVESREQTAADIKQTGEKRRALTGIEAMVSQAGGPLSTIEKLIGHPSRELMTGGSTVVGTPWSWVPGTDAAEFRALQKKAGSQAFIDSITQLRVRGGTVGQITEREGDKLESARLNLVNASTEAQFLEELTNFRKALHQFVMVAREEAGLDPFTPYSRGGIDLTEEYGGAQQPTMTPAQQAVYDKYAPKAGQQ